jgi:fermentation-respiration switch protein FrsA (DUF1100 family)
MPFCNFSTDDYLLNISNSEKIKQYQGRLELFHGTDDKILPYSMGQHVYKSYPSHNKEIIPLSGGGHDAPFEKTAWGQSYLEDKEIITSSHYLCIRYGCCL